MLSFTTAYAIGKQFENPLVRYSIYAAGMITPVSRLWAGAHWVTDVALGIAISVAVVDSIDNYLKKEGRYESDRQKPMIQWSFAIRSSESRSGWNILGLSNPGYICFF